MALAGGIADWVTAKFLTDSKPAPQGTPPPGAPRVNLEAAMSPYPSILLAG
jgi:hypothetical protein